MQTLTIEQTKELRRLCYAGRLYDIEKLLAPYGMIAVHPDVKRVPIDIALKLGFHSLVELLIRHTDDIAVKNHALGAAVRKGRFDIVEMLVNHGADPLSVPYEDVLCSYSADMGRYFMSKGADLVSGYPFAVAFKYHKRPALGVYLDAQRDFPNLKGALQRQLDMALSYHCEHGSLRWVALLLWAHGNPFARVPNLEYPDELENPEMFDTGVSRAARAGNLEVIKKIGIDPRVPEWQEALNSACSFRYPEVVEVILKAGVNPNDKPNGGSSGLDSAINHMDMGARLSHHSPYHYACTASSCMQSITALVKHGARWNPDDRTALNTARRSLYWVDKSYTVELIKLFATYGACGKELLFKFITSPKMIERLVLIDVEKIIDKHWRKGTIVPPALAPVPLSRSP